MVAQALYRYKLLVANGMDENRALQNMSCELLNDINKEFNLNDVNKEFYKMRKNNSFYNQAKDKSVETVKKMKEKYNNKSGSGNGW